MVQVLALDLSWALALHVLRQGLGNIVLAFRHGLGIGFACFSDKVWGKIVLALRYGPSIGSGLVMGIGFACFSDKVWEKIVLAFRHGLGIGFACFSNKGWGKIVLALRHGPGIGFGLVMGIGFACSQTRSGKNSFSAQTWFGHGLALVLRHGLGKIVLSLTFFLGMGYASHAH